MAEDGQLNALPYYKRYMRDLFEGTVGMEGECKRTYSLLLDLIYLHRGRLPDDPQYIAGQLGMSVRQWNKIKGQLQKPHMPGANAKIRCEHGIISNFRADKEVLKLSNYSKQQSENRTGSNKINSLQKPPSQPTKNQRLTISESESEKDIHNSEFFDSFWAVAVNKVSKDRARDALDRAIRYVSPDMVLDAWKAANAEWAKKPLDQREFIPHPHTWLNEKRWTDEPPKAKSTTFNRSDLDDDFWRDAVKRYAQKIGSHNPDSPPPHIWSDQLGPPPPHRNCEAPLHILKLFGYR